MLRRTISVKDESTPTMSRLKACQSGAAANRRFSRGEVNVRYGSLADVRGIRDVRFTLRSGHAHRRHQCLICAINRHWLDAD